MAGYSAGDRWAGCTKYPKHSRYGPFLRALRNLMLLAQTIGFAGWQAGGLLRRCDFSANGLLSGASLLDLRRVNALRFFNFLHGVRFGRMINLIEYRLRVGQLRFKSRYMGAILFQW